MMDVTQKVFTPSTIYLCMYNLMLSLGWTILMIQFSSHMIYGDGVPGLWNATSVSLLLFQSMAILEVVHCAIGIVRSSVMLTFSQVFSRVFLTWAILYSLPAARTSYGFPLVLFAWSLTEIVRYMYYFLSLIGILPQFLTFLRYTLFIVLYPLGVTGEMLCYFSVLPLVKQHRPMSVLMPNSVNFSFDSYYGLILVIALYVPAFPQLYFHMLAQRKKILGGGDAKKKQ